MQKYLLILLIFLTFAANASEPKDAIRFALKDDWAKAIAASKNDPLTKKIVNWMYLQDENSDATFGEITSFINKNSNWPDIDLLKRRAEEAISVKTPDAEIAKWFAENPPQTAKGMIAYAETIKDKKQAQELLKKAYINGDFGAKEEEDFLTKYGNLISIQDYKLRIDNLIWEEKPTQASRIISKMGAESSYYQSIISLIGGNFKQPPKNDQMAKFALADYYLRTDKDEELAKIVLQAGKSSHPESWWNLRKRAAREFIKQKDFNSAYKIASENGLKSGTDFAEAEWMAGWLALSKLDRPKQAYEHFNLLFQNVKTPPSLARAAYWAGRAQKAIGDKTNADKWFLEAAKYPTQFYGQLAAAELNKNLQLPDIKISQADISAAKKSEMVRASEMMFSLNFNGLGKKFIGQAIKNAKTDQQIAAITYIGYQKRDYNFSVVASREAAQRGVIVPETAFPIPQHIDNGQVERSLVMALIRQESNFDNYAKSSVGATGLMQLMPETARNIAREIKVPFNQANLTNEAYNTRFGTYYLNKRINEFDGSYILAVASYNAGKKNVDKWITQYGDPRQHKDLYDIVDWIEQIPFGETRNYVQRVIENNQSYRAIMAGNNIVQPNLIVSDLKR